MHALVVHIENTQSGEVRTRAFQESPVRIGRSPFANLRLREPFISEWHAVVRFHTSRTTYLDLGSRNPTHINGRATERNVELDVDERSDVRIGTLRLRFVRTAQPGDLADPGSDQQTASEPAQFGEPERPTGTQVLALPERAAPPLPVRPAPHHEARARHCAPPDRPQPPAQRTVREVARESPPMAAGGIDALVAAHHAYRRAFGEFLGMVRADLDNTAGPARAARVLAIRSNFPELMQEPGFCQIAQQAGVRGAQLGHLDVQDWLGRLCGMPSTATPEQTATTMERVGQLLEIFSEAFIESRRAHQRARKRLALDATAARPSPLQQSEDPHALLAYLLDPGADVRARSQELRRSLADFAMHQIALLSAVVEGARTLLDQLAPDKLREYREPRHAAAALDKEQSHSTLWPYAARKLWRKFVVCHHDLTQADHFTHALFGREFQRRYHAIADSTLAVVNAEPGGQRSHGAAR